MQQELLLNIIPFDPPAGKQKFAFYKQKQADYPVHAFLNFASGSVRYREGSSDERYIWKDGIIRRGI